MSRKGYHQLNEVVPQGKNPRENEVRHPEVPSLVSKKDERRQTMQKEEGYPVE
ncbi:MAG: hypothetical protein ACOYEH_02465 [Caldicoprobacterales bacterium]|nr:hypothetical protein [Clostridiales bacterium]